MAVHHLAVLFIAEAQANLKLHHAIAALSGRHLVSHLVADTRSCDQHKIRRAIAAR